MSQDGWAATTSNGPGPAAGVPGRLCSPAPGAIMAKTIPETIREPFVDLPCLWQRSRAAKRHPGTRPG